MSAPGGCLLPGVVSAPGGCLLPGGVCYSGVSPPGGVCSWGGVRSEGCLLWGVSAPWGVIAPGGVCSWGVVPQHALRQTPRPVNRITHTCKTLPWPNFVAAGKYSRASIAQSVERLSGLTM